MKRRERETYLSLISFPYQTLSIPPFSAPSTSPVGKTVAVTSKVRKTLNSQPILPYDLVLGRGNGVVKLEWYDVRAPRKEVEEWFMVGREGPSLELWSMGNDSLMMNSRVDLFDDDDEEEVVDRIVAVKGVGREGGKGAVVATEQGYVYKTDFEDGGGWEGRNWVR